METVESSVDTNKQVMHILNDTNPYTSTNDNQELGDDSPSIIHNEAFEKYEILLNSAKQELYPGSGLFGSRGHYGVDSWKNQVLYVKSVF